MHDASIILVLMLLWQGGWFLAAAIRYIVTAGAPMEFRRRYMLSFISYAVPVLLLYIANHANFNHRQLWMAGSYNFTARLLPPAIEHLPEMLYVLGSIFLLAEFTHRSLFRKEQARFIPLLLSIVLWISILAVLAVLAPSLRVYIFGSLQLALYFVLLTLPPVAIICGLWSADGKIIYTMMAIFIAWNIVLGIIGYLFFSETLF